MDRASTIIIWILLAMLAVEVYGVYLQRKEG